MSDSTPLPLPIIHRVSTNGNSYAVVIPSQFIQKTGIRQGDKVEVLMDYQAGTITYKFLSIRQLNLV